MSNEYIAYGIQLVAVFQLLMTGAIILLAIRVEKCLRLLRQQQDQQQGSETQIQKALL